jgi:hypothetical protein
MLGVAPAWYTLIPSTYTRQPVIGREGLTLALAVRRLGDETLAPLVGEDTFTVTVAANIGRQSAPNIIKSKKSFDLIFGKTLLFLVFGCSHLRGRDGLELSEERVRGSRRGSESAQVGLQGRANRGSKEKPVAGNIRMLCFVLNWGNCSVRVQLGRRGESLKLGRFVALCQ